MILLISLFFIGPSLCAGQTEGNEKKDGAYFDPLDPFDYFGSEELNATDDKDKSAEELVRESLTLFQTEHLLDARTKLLKALQKDPENIRAHYFLAGYYLSSVGHYRLALKYAKRALELAEKKHGPPPYSDPRVQLDHSTILTYISQIRLNLDNYTGALETLDEFVSYGYYDESTAGSRAWILMKLGKIQEAIKVARLGVMTDTEPGRTLNMLGILLSMNDQKEEAIDIFRKAISFEMSLGTKGQPATPLNNVGEVYRELFEDDKAESSFLRASGMKDGCEHFLPTLNIVLLYIEQMKYQAAATAIDNFLQCMAQFPLRNDEEYGALLKLARGRIDLHTGHLERAISRLEEALEGTQWFGKIGTNQNDLIAAANATLSQALDRRNNILSTYRPTSWSEWYEIKKERIDNATRSWWHMRKARQVLTNELKDIEDLIVRNTDSLLEYPTLGEVLKGLRRISLTRRIEQQRKDDTRGPAQVFYDEYLAESSLGFWHRNEGVALLDTVIQRARPKYDELLRTQAMLNKMKVLDAESQAYQDLAYKVLLLGPAELRNHGLKLPVKVDVSGANKSLQSSFLKGPFLPSKNDSVPCVVRGTSDTDGKHRLVFSCTSAQTKNRVADDPDPNIVVNKLSNLVFQEEISNGGNS
jgi:Tfp pilus assembly protein PilF